MEAKHLYMYLVSFSLLSASAVMWVGEPPLLAFHVLVGNLIVSSVSIMVYKLFIRY